MRDVWRSVVLAGGARGYGLLLQLLTLLLTARVLGPDGRGVLAAATAWALLYFTVGNLSLGQVALHRAAESPGGGWLAPTARVLVRVMVVASMVSWVVAAATYLATGGGLYGHLRPGVLALAMAALPALIWEQYGSSLLTATGRLSAYNRAQVVGRTLGLALAAALLLGLRTGVAGALVALLVAQVVVAAGGARGLRLLASAEARTGVERLPAWTMLRDGAKLHLNAIGTFLSTTATVLVVSHYRGEVETGRYQLAVQLTAFAVIIPQSASYVVYGHVAQGGADAAWAVNRRLLLTISGVMLAAAAVAVVLAPTLLPLVAGDAFRPSVPLFQLLTLTWLGQGLSVLMAPQWIGRGYFSQVSALAVAIGGISIAATMLLVPRYGATGAAWATVGVYAVSVLVNGGFALRIESRIRREQHGAPAAADVRP